MRQNCGAMGRKLGVGILGCDCPSQNISKYLKKHVVNTKKNVG
jgi:hypothetical protein